MLQGRGRIGKVAILRHLTRPVVEYVTLDLGVVSLSPTLGGSASLEKKKKRKESSHLLSVGCSSKTPKSLAFFVFNWPFESNPL